MTTGHDFFSDAFVRAAGPHGAWVGEQLEAFNAFMPMGEWSVNLNDRVYRQSGREVAVSVLGSFSTGDDSWLWGWANPSWGDPEVTSAARALRAIGERDGIPEFTTDLVHLSGFADPRMAAETIAFAAMGLLGSDGYIGVTANATGRLYMVVDDKQVPRAKPDAITLPRMLVTGAGFLPVPHEAVVAGYFTHHGLATRRVGDGVQATLDSGDPVHVDFDEHGRISQVRVSAAPRSVPSGAWWHVAGPGVAQALEQDGEFTGFITEFPYEGHDLTRRVLTCGPHEVRVRVLGTVDPASNRWTWDADTHARLSALPGLAQAPEAEREVDLSACEDTDAVLTLLSHGAAGLLGGGCVVDFADERGHNAYVCVDDPVVPRATSPDAVAQAVRGASEVAARLLPAPRRTAVATALTESYLSARGTVTRRDTPEATALESQVANATVKVRITPDGTTVVEVN
ncbi:DUF6882 domain-containing protein [Yinghuangia sp. YIM S09857]|uniref:DUF6882 domain-containing protein n=1 Tax=Yinghuangia sp. YIM S09857 TaxID=3436929 RepID=UPI003F5383D8